jgi:hypothetical protein
VRGTSISVYGIVSPLGEMIAGVKGEDEMSLDVYLTAVRRTEVHWSNITHNLGAMAREAGIYMHLWRPDDIGISKAFELIGPLKDGLKILKRDPERFKKLNAENGWGTYEQFVPFVEEYLRACVDNPDAKVSISR